MNTAGQPQAVRGLLVRRAIATFVVAYLVVTVLASTVTITYAAIEHTGAEDAGAASPVLSPSFSATVPYHVLIMLLVWPVSAGVYLRRLGRADRRDRMRHAVLLSAFWLFAAMAVDFLGFVVIKNPWSLTPHQFYVDYQPWITLIYVSIALSPWIALAAARRAGPVAPGPADRDPTDAGPTGAGTG
jgi:hypothetical protein